ncbi:ADP-ribose pyrophosphatase YjhB, NUDIX family [Paenibacillus sp. 1_12]|uniref:NUDIX domain-containing protein n=1 Tax=Paenibacillus sp. 1_12 TaxID=1566278 RepID=UPI0008E61332|nr:NUDIX domain-containing protein [Paenibacillus sp. 1_12]SFM18596.1 ADP-ribose pyrophosphatase YjhB, NUDIX family [Paenibacillus sp. 1_12]
MKPIRNSAKAIIIQEGKVLLTKNQDEQGFFYLFPGGGQESGEELINAVFRECMEEIGAEIIVNDLLYVREYIGKNHEFAEWDFNIHQVEFYFMCQLKDPHTNISNGINPDSYQVGVEWVELETIEEIRLYPKKLGIIIKNKIESRIYIGDVN